jgi:transposase InsO family protein/transposase
MADAKPGPTPRRIFLYLLLCVAIARGTALGAIWRAHGRRQRLALDYVEAVLDAERIEAQVALLLGRLRRAKGMRRFNAREWQFILEFGERWGRTNAQLARDVGVSAATVSRRRRRWRQAGRIVAEPPKPKPPCPRIADNRRAVVRDMVREGYKSNLTISRHIALQGEEISPRSVGRFRREFALPASKEPPLAEGRDHPAGEAPPRPPLKEFPEVADRVSAYVVGSEPLARPRAARLIRLLAEAFAQGIALDNLWLLDAEDSDEAFAARIREAKRRRSRVSEQLEIVERRLCRIPPARRQRFLDTERAAILAFKHLYRLSNKTTAKWFFVDENTLSNWGRDVDGLGGRQRPLVQPIPDAEAAIAAVLATLPRVPDRLKPAIQKAIAALAEKAPVRKRKSRKATADSPVAVLEALAHCVAAQPAPGKLKRHRIEAKYRNHYWGCDLTVIPLGHHYYLAAIVDLYSRDILAWELFATQPASEDVAALFNQAVARHGKPKHFVTDHGGQFLGSTLQALITSLDVDHRKGAVGEHGSIAITERLWRTAKECLDLKAVRPNVPAILKHRVAVVIDYYRTKRPHSKLSNATPAEVFHDLPSRAHHTQRAPRGHSSPPLPFRIRHAFPDDRKLPYLERVA